MSCFSSGGQPEIRCKSGFQPGVLSETPTERTKSVPDQNDDRDRRASWISEAAGAHDETLVENWLLRLRRERFRSRQSGKSHDFYVAYLKDGANVVALTPGNEVVMVRQFRAGLHRDSLETPGGLIESGEDPRAAGARELLEETGYAGDPPELLGSIWPNPGLLAQRIWTIVIRNAMRIAEPAPDQTEELTVELVPVSKILTLIKQGEIEHGVCVAGLLWWLANRDEP
jgi:8-oxo-dGTP pyrophosphatase MutT (NUDIX family)